MTPLTNQKLVEAIELVLNGRSILYQHEELALKEALKEASEPMKEFPPGSGMSKKTWASLAKINADTCFGKACRQIADGLSE